MAPPTTDLAQDDSQHDETASTDPANTSLSLDRASQLLFAPNTDTLEIAKAILALPTNALCGQNWWRGMGIDTEDRCMICKKNAETLNLIKTGSAASTMDAKRFHTFACARDAALERKGPRLL